MKKTIVYILSAILVMSVFAACAYDDDPGKNPGEGDGVIDEWNDAENGIVGDEDTPNTNGNTNENNGNLDTDSDTGINEDTDNGLPSGDMGTTNDQNNSGEDHNTAEDQNTTGTEANKNAGTGTQTE